MRKIFIIFWRKILERIKIKSIKKTADFEDVYDIQNYEQDVFCGEPNFIIDDVLTHNCGKHAGGCLLLDKPVWEYMPVTHTKDGVVSAFVESGAQSDLDEIGVVKYDFLAITILEVISNAVEAIKEPLVRIIDDDGLEKIVPESYIHK